MVAAARAGMDLQNVTQNHNNYRTIVKLRVRYLIIVPINFHCVLNQ